jgi:chemotaxis protein CheX
MTITNTLSAASVTAAIVNPIIAATKDTFQNMFDSPVTRKHLGLKTPDTKFHGLNAVISLTGDAVGSICLSVPEETAFEAVFRLLDMKVDRPEGLVSDTVGEMANVIAGSAKDRMTQLNMELGIPNVIRGTNVTIDFPSSANPMFVTFETSLGEIMIVFGFLTNCCH